MEFRNHYFQKHNILKKGKIEKQPCPKTDEMYKKALAASNLKSGGTIFNMIEGLEQPTHDRIGRVLNNEKRKRTLQESANKKLTASDSEDEDIPLALLAKQSGGQLPWEEPNPKKKRARKKTVENGHSETALVPIEDPPIEPSQPPTQVAARKSKVKKKEDRKPTRRSGRAKTAKSYIGDLDEDEENDEELLGILNAAQQKLTSKRTQKSPVKKPPSNDQSVVRQAANNEGDEADENPSEGSYSFHFGAIQSHQTTNSVPTHVDTYPVNPFNISQQEHLTPTPPIENTPSALHYKNYSSTSFTPTQTPYQFNPKPNLTIPTVSQQSYGPLFDFETDL